MFIFTIMISQNIWTLFIHFIGRKKQQKVWNGQIFWAETPVQVMSETTSFTIYFSSRFYETVILQWLGHFCVRGVW